MEQRSSARSRVQTLRPPAAAIVLIVGGPDALREATRRVAEAESPLIMLEHCEPAGSATAAATVRPFSIVISEDVYQFDPAEFGALARDVGARLIALRVDGVPRTVIEQALRQPLRSAFRTWRSQNQSGPVSSG